DSAKGSRKLIQQVNLAAALALKASGSDTNRQLADVLLRARVAGKDPVITYQMQIPHELTLKLLPVARAALHGPADVVSRRLTSIRIWGPLQPPPKGNEIEEVLDIAYRDDAKADAIRHRLDLFVPRGKKDFPVVVLV